MTFPLGGMGYDVSDVDGSGLAPPSLQIQVQILPFHQSHKVNSHCGTSCINHMTILMLTPSGAIAQWYRYC
jgi:hypothetical protein